MTIKKKKKTGQQLDWLAHYFIESVRRLSLRTFSRDAPCMITTMEAHSAEINILIWVPFSVYSLELDTAGTEGKCPFLHRNPSQISFFDKYQPVASWSGIRLDSPLSQNKWGIVFVTSSKNVYLAPSKSPHFIAGNSSFVCHHQITVLNEF